MTPNRRKAKPRRAAVFESLALQQLIIVFSFCSPFAAALALVATQAKRLQVVLIPHFAT
jgi:hypothetical protein